MKHKVVSWDSGTSFEKIVIGGGKDQQLKFPSNVYRVSDDDNFSVSKGNLTENNLRIKFEDTTYYVGKLAIEQDSKGGSRNFKGNGFTEPSEIAKFLVGMAYLTKENYIEIGLLMLDLNIMEYRSLEQQLSNIYKNKSFLFEIAGIEYQIVINNVKVNPQGVGCYYDQVLDFEGNVLESDLLNSRYAILDIGGRTVDGFIAEGIEPIDGTQFGTEEGMTDAFKRVGQRLGVPWTLVENSYITGKPLYYGHKRNIEESCRKEIQRLAERIYNEADSYWSKHLARVSDILLCGGGGQSTVEHFETLFDNKEVRLSENAQFANANGNFKLGILMRRRANEEKTL